MLAGGVRGPQGSGGLEALLCGDDGSDGALRALCLYCGCPAAGRCISFGGCVPHRSRAAAGAIGRVAGGVGVGLCFLLLLHHKNGF